MSTKTIAVENSVYERLAREKRSSESFTKTIDRLIHASNIGTCAAAVADAATVWQAIGNDADADRMEQVIHQNRVTTNWEVERPA
jgi:predicted CopG family antitoxin